MKDKFRDLGYRKRLNKAVQVGKTHESYPHQILVILYSKSFSQVLCRFWYIFCILICLLCDLLYDFISHSARVRTLFYIFYISTGAEPVIDMQELFFDNYDMQKMCHKNAIGKKQTPFKKVKYNKDKAKNYVR